jgi:hypothetical protein
MSLFSCDGVVLTREGVAPAPAATNRAIPRSAFLFRVRSVV